MSVGPTAQDQDWIKMECAWCRTAVKTEVQYSTECFLVQQSPLCPRCLSAGKRWPMIVSSTQRDPLRN